jgi:catechol 2,3-dioxygenase-like lactoylglutathione lyase family enzyme
MVRQDAQLVGLENRPKGRLGERVMNMEVRNIRWIGVPTENYDAMRELLERVMGLRVNFDDPTTVELVTTEGDEIQLMAPGDPYFDFFLDNARGPVPLFEVDDVHAARAELESAGIAIIGDVGRDSRWEWIHFRAPDGNLYELASRLTRPE